MKKTLAYDKRALQFHSEIMGKRFYLGPDAGIAQQRKVALVKLASNCPDGKWATEALTAAEAIRTGTPVKIEAMPDEHQQPDKDELIATLMNGTGKQISGTPANLSDYQRATEALLMERIAELEALVKKHIGAGVVEGPKITIHAALDAYHAARLKSEINIDTGLPTEFMAPEGSYCRMLKRLISDMPLSRLNKQEINNWCRAVAARPLTKNGKKRISRDTVKNSLSLIRRFLRWASDNYGWDRPIEWREATLVRPRRTKQERRDAKAIVDKYYTVEEIGTIWKYARGVERLLILLGLNFGYSHAEILDMLPADLSADIVFAIRGKSEAIGKWAVWTETQQLAKWFDKIPRKRQGIANIWTKLLDRTIKNEPAFRRKSDGTYNLLSFKWLRKTGSSLIRKTHGAELASLYLSHGEKADTDDKLLEIYAATNWDTVVSSIVKLGDEIRPYLQTAQMQGKPHVKLSVIDQIKAGWLEGLDYKQIVAKVGVSRDTVYKYRPALAATA